MNIDILVPTLGRPQALGPLLDNIREVTPEGVYKVILVVDFDDDATRTELARLGRPYLLADGTYPEKMNAGFLAGEAPLVLATNDDVVFHPGWYEKTLDVFTDTQTMVVGCDDLTPATADRRSLATMPALRRSYCESPGASFEEPGVIYHEGYHHNYSETEVWHLAHHRGVAAWSEAVIEHKHPVWRTATVDATYEKGGLANFAVDKALFEKRQKQWLRTPATV